MAELLLTAAWDGASLNTFFIQPYLLLRNRPEVYAFKGKKQVFIVESGSGGIMAHAHKLTQVQNVTPIVKGALVYFKIESEYLHSHPDTKKLYYIGKVSDGSYKIFNASNNAVTTTAWGAGHYHSLNIREVIDIP